MKEPSTGASAGQAEAPCPAHADPLAHARFAPLAQGLLLGTLRKNPAKRERHSPRARPDCAHPCVPQAIAQLAPVPASAIADAQSNAGSYVQHVQVNALGYAECGRVRYACLIDITEGPPGYALHG